MPAYLLDVRPHLEYTSDTDVVNTKAARCGEEVGVAWEAADRMVEQAEDVPALREGRRRQAAL
jgi:hypothetical protein